MQQGGKRIHGSVKQPVVSIVTAVYNAAGLLPNFLAKVMPYLNSEVELIIADGNSTDGTVEILKNQKSKIDFWVSEPDKGIYDAMNKAVQWAQGNWVIFLGVDDYLEPGFTNMLAELTDPHTIYYGDSIYYGKPHNMVYDAYYLTKLNFVHQSLFYPRAVFAKYQYSLEYPVYADYHLNLQLWADKSYRFEHRSYTVAGFPAGGFSTHAKDPQFEKERNKLFKKYLGRKAYYRYLNRTLGFFKAFLRIVTNG